MRKDLYILAISLITLGVVACSPGFEPKHRKGVTSGTTANITGTATLDANVEVTGVILAGSSSTAQVLFSYNGLNLNANVPQPRQGQSAPTHGSQQSGDTTFDVSLLCGKTQCNYLVAHITSSRTIGGTTQVRRSAALFDQYTSQFDGNALVPALAYDDVSFATATDAYTPMVTEFENTLK